MPGSQSPRAQGLQGPAQTTSCPGRLGPMSEGPRVDQLSWATRAGVRGPVGSTRCPGLLGLLSEVPRVPSALPGDSSMVRGTTGSTSTPGRIALCTRALGLVPGKLGPCPRACGVDQLSQMTRALVRGHMGSTSCPWRLGPMSQVPRYRPAVPGKFGPCRWTTVSTAAPGDSGPGPRYCGIEEHSRATRARVQGPAGLTSSPGRLGNRSVVPRGRSAHRGDSGSCPMARGVDQLSRRSRARLRCPADSTTCPRLLWLGYCRQGVEYTPG